MKRTLFISLLIPVWAIILLAGLGTYVVGRNAAGLAQDISARLNRELDGVSVSAERAGLRFFPSPALELHDVVIRTHDGVLLASSCALSPRWLRLLTGSVALSGLSLDEPVLRYEVDATPSDAPLSLAIDPAALEVLSGLTLTIRNGELQLVQTRNGQRTPLSALTGLNGSLQLPEFEGKTTSEAGKAQLTAEAFHLYATEETEGKEGAAGAEGAKNAAAAPCFTLAHPALQLKNTLLDQNESLQFRTALSLSADMPFSAPERPGRLTCTASLTLHDLALSLDGAFSFNDTLVLDAKSVPATLHIPFRTAMQLPDLPESIQIADARLSLAGDEGVFNGELRIGPTNSTNPASPTPPANSVTPASPTPSANPASPASPTNPANPSNPANPDFPLLTGHLAVSRFSLPRWFDFAEELPDGLKHALDSLSGDLNISLTPDALHMTDARLHLLDMPVSGSGSVQHFHAPVVRIDLRTETLRLDRLLISPNISPATGKTATQPAALRNTPPERTTGNTAGNAAGKTTEKTAEKPAGSTAGTAAGIPAGTAAEAKGSQTGSQPESQTGGKASVQPPAGTTKEAKAGNTSRKPDGKTTGTAAGKTAGKAAGTAAGMTAGTSASSPAGTTEDTATDYLVRIQAQTVVLQGLSGRHLALEIAPQGDVPRMDIQLGDLFGGRGSGSLTFGEPLHLVATLSAVSMERLLTALGQPADWRGQLTAEASLDATGDTLPDLLASLRGRLAVRLDKGSRLLADRKTRFSFNTLSLAFQGETGRDTPSSTVCTGKWSGEVDTGTLRFRAEASGPVRCAMDRGVQFGTTGLQSRLSGSLNGLPWTLSALVGFSTGQHTLDLKDIRGTAEGSSLTGTLRGSALDRTPRWEGNAAFTSTSVRRLLDARGLLPSGIPQTSLKTGSASARFGMTGDTLTISSLNGMLDKTSFAGELERKPGARRPLWTFELRLGTLDLDRYLPQGPSDTTPLRLNEKLLAQDARGRVSIQNLVVEQVPHEQLTIPIVLENGILTADPITASVAGGKAGAGFRAEAVADGALVRLRYTLTGCDMYRLSLARHQVDLVSGTGSLDADASGRIRTSADIPRALTGTWKFAVTNGGLGKDFRFSHLGASGKLASGILSSRDMQLRGPKFNVQGNGWVNLIQKTLDYNLVVSGSGLPDIPVHYYGSLSNPKRSISASGFILGTLSSLFSGTLDVLDTIISAPLRYLKPSKGL